MKAHPFSTERCLGMVFAIDGSYADVALAAANKLPGVHLGEPWGGAKSDSSFWSMLAA